MKTLNLLLTSLLFLPHTLLAVPTAVDSKEKVVAKSGKFSSSLLNKAINGEAPASILPHWYGYAWEPAKSRVAPVADLWTEAIYKEIYNNAPALTTIVPKDIQNICPKYPTMSKEARTLFWVKLVSVLAAKESMYNVEAKFDDTKNISGSSNKVISTGLLQISHLSSQQSAYNCKMISADPIQGAKDLKDGIKNMRCGIQIMNYWVSTDQALAFSPKNLENGRPFWNGLARYWGPFRHPTLAESARNFWEVLSRREDRWVNESKERDAYLQAEFKEKKAAKEPWTFSDWSARRSKAPHPSFLEAKYEKEESHAFTTISRIMTQTATCYQ